MGGVRSISGWAGHLELSTQVTVPVCTVEIREFLEKKKCCIVTKSNCTSNKFFLRKSVVACNGLSWKSFSIPVVPDILNIVWQEKSFPTGSPYLLCFAVT